MGSDESAYIFISFVRLAIRRVECLVISGNGLDLTQFSVSSKKKMGCSRTGIFRDNGELKSHSSVKIHVLIKELRSA